jgi:hypothetical protein
MMSSVCISITPDDNALRKHRHFPLLGEKRTRQSHPHVLLGERMTWNNQQSGGIVRFPTILGQLINEHQQGNTSTYNDKKRKKGTDDVGRRKGKIRVALISTRLSTLSSSKKTGAGSFLRFVVTDVKREHVILQLFSGADQIDRSRSVCCATSLVPPDFFVSQQALLLQKRSMHIQRCVCPPGRKQKTATRTRPDGFVSHAGDQPTFAGDQEKDGNSSEPGKPKKPKKEKPEREGEKGKRKGKSPRTEELVPSIT